MPQWINGKEVAEQIKLEVASQVEELGKKRIRPGLAVVLVGEDPASQVYVRGKVKTCLALGMYSEKIELSSDADTGEILGAVETLNQRKDIHGFLVQLPLPSSVDTRRVLNAIMPEKDVDGIHPVNVGRLVAGSPCLKPCTPAGIMEIFKRYNIEVHGSRAVVIGRSDIVGKPLALMLLHAHATVTVCHSRTLDLRKVAQEADILVAAMGKPAFVDDTFIKQGAAVIDVGTNRLDSLERIREIFGDDPKRLADHAKKGYTLVGDVNPGKVFPKTSFLTPVPGGVGPLTIAMLMANTVKAAASANHIPLRS
jgi:methylenetetrahydrofolate dehydrogenase (NADP+)/methenyltetrahydrofolate cyclohydrolase